MFRNTRSGARDSLPTPGNDRSGGGGVMYDAAEDSKPVVSKHFIATMVWALLSLALIGGGWGYCCSRSLESTTVKCDTKGCKVTAVMGGVTKLLDIPRPHMVRGALVRVGNGVLVDIRNMKISAQRKLGHSYAIVYKEPRDMNPWQVTALKATSDGSEEGAPGMDPPYGSMKLLLDYGEWPGSEKGGGPETVATVKAVKGADSNQLSEEETQGEGFLADGEAEADAGVLGWGPRFSSVNDYVAGVAGVRRKLITRKAAAEANGGRHHHRKFHHKQGRPTEAQMRHGRNYQNSRWPGHGDLKMLGTSYNLGRSKSRKRKEAIDYYVSRRSNSVYFMDSTKWTGVGLWMMIVGSVSAVFCLVAGNFKPRASVLNGARRLLLLSSFLKAVGIKAENTIRSAVGARGGDDDHARDDHARDDHARDDHARDDHGGHGGGVEDQEERLRNEQLQRA